MATVNRPLPRLYLLIAPAALSNSSTIHPKVAVPALTLLSLLPKASLLALRLVSKPLRTLVDTHQSSPLVSLHILFPLPDNISVASLATLGKVAQNCKYLTIQCRSPPRDACPNAPSLLPLPSLVHLTIVAPPPDRNAFHKLLALRLALQCAALPSLTHLTLSHLSIQGTLALRDGPFTAFSNNTGADFLRNIRSLSLSILPWWLPTESDTVIHNNPSLILSHASRNAFKILHDFLSSFSSHTFSHLRFEWIGLDDGPNPLLLDDWAARQDGSRKGWFSAKGIRWRMVKAVRFRGVEIMDADVREMRRRVEGLERLEVETWWGEDAVEGGLVMGDTGEWVVDVLGEGVGLEEGQDAGGEERKNGLGEAAGERK